jgi:hypothetical protein
MAKLNIRHHEPVERDHPYCWHVYLHGREKPVPVELPPDERQALDMSDEEIHETLPEALERYHAASNRDDVLPGEEYQEATWDAPVRVMQTHFIA